MKHKKWLWPAVPLLVASGAYAYLDAGSRARLETVEKGAKAAGLALTPDDLRRRSPSSADNAADLYRQAVAEYALIPPLDTLISEKSYFGKHGEFAAELRRAGFSGVVGRTRSEAAVAKYDAVFKLIGAAETKPNLDWNYRWEDALNIHAPELRHVKAILRAMIADADVAAGSANIGRMRKRLEQGAMVARHVGQMPTWHDMLISRSLYEILSGGCVKIALRHRSPLVLAALKEILTKLKPDYDFRLALQGETVTSLERLRTSVEHPELFAQAGHAAAPWYDVATIQFKTLRVGFLGRNMRSRVISQYLTAHNSSRKVDRKDQLAMSRRLIQDMPEPFEPPFHLLAPQISSGIVTSEVKFLVWFRLAIEVIENLRQDSPFRYQPVLTDPFCGKPFLFKRTNGRFALYSVGKNRIDDGGPAAGADDIGFLVQIAPEF